MRWECWNIYLNIHTLLKITFNFKKCFKNEEVLYYRFNFSDFLTPFLVIAKFSYFFCFSHLITLHFITHHYLDIFLLQSRTSFSQWTSDCKQHAQFRTSIHSNFRRLGLDLLKYHSSLLSYLSLISIQQLLEPLLWGMWYPGRPTPCRTPRSLLTWGSWALPRPGWSASSW